MAMPHDDLSPEEMARQAGLDASYETAQRRLKDRQLVAALRRRLAQLDTEPRPARLTRAEFLQRTTTHD